MTIRTFTALAAAALLATSASADDFSFTGTFAFDNDKAGYIFTVPTATTVTLTSLGYAGGTNLAGASIAQGGFDTVLSLYDFANFLVADNDDGEGVPLDSVTGQGGDAKLSLSLAAGTYRVFLTQYNNFGPIQLPGFAFDGQSDFRDGFVDFYGDQRTGNWALDISGVGTAGVAGPVPEPATWALLIGGFFMVGAVARRRKGAVAA